MFGDVITDADLVQFLLDQHKQTNNIDFLIAADALCLYRRDCELYKFQLDQQNKWISVEDRLPEKRTRVLCYHKYEPESPDVICENDYLVGGLWRFDGSKVTHWMPLPPLPKTEED